jgi:hypothetical protein
MDEDERDIEMTIDTESATTPGDRDFALARGFSRVDNDPRPFSEILKTDLLTGFGD